jgi:DNA-binding LacI/PurR family transcriptional regulator
MDVKRKAFWVSSPDLTDSASTGRRATAADVARMAGVSQATVSYVINDAPDQSIPQPTRARVLEAARALHYRPSSHARALRRGRSDTVLLLLPDWPFGPALSEMVEKVTTELAGHGLSLLIRRMQRAQPLSTLWHDVSPAGVISLGAVSESDRAVLREAGIPLAATVHPDRPGSGQSVLVPQARMGRMQVEHLVAAGHRYLGYAALDDERLTAAFLTPRLKGVRAACRDAGLAAPVVERLSLDGREAARAVAVWRRRGVTAVCAYNDDVAFAVLAGLRISGLSAPDDLAVIGVDDVPLAPLAAPPLTTIRMDLAAIAHQLTAGIIAERQGLPALPDPTSDVIELVPRESA